ncbi:uncharacterized protein LOC102704854 [Oryza brachyantha]|uniref:Uncharacterized protein n=1 Tax=Oryza brachyantha TaxID=4533 RepID=J3KWT0_ORYBR|nr:uncharacterized protein LOC102704854 [Oryza brachyantha]
MVVGHAICCLLAADGDAARCHMTASALLDAQSGEHPVLLDGDPRATTGCSHGVAAVGHGQAFAGAMRQRREEVPPDPLRVVLREEHVGWTEVVTCANGNKIDHPSGLIKKAWRASVRNICRFVASAVRFCWDIGTHMLPLWAAAGFRRRLPTSAVPEKFSWRNVMSTFRFQIFPDTCAIVACSVCIEAQHRLEFERLHGQGTFILELPDSTRNLRRLCQQRQVWVKDKGACMDGLLSVIRTTGGVPATSTTTNTRRGLLQLPLHSHDSFSLRGSWTNLTPRRAAQLIFTGGPCIGILWVDGSYADKRHYSDDDGELDMLVYLGCDPKKKKKRSSNSSKEDARLHAVVCYGYRFTGQQQLHIRVQDNMPIHSPHNWILFEAFDMFYTVRVTPLDASRLYDPSVKVPPKISQKMGKDRALVNANLRRLHDAVSQ